MTQIARYARVVARDGRGEELSERLLAAAEHLQSDPGCELYLISREAGRPDSIWVTELWRSQQELDASFQRIRERGDVTATMSLADKWEMIELELLGGKGPSS